MVDEDRVVATYRGHNIYFLQDANLYRIEDDFAQRYASLKLAKNAIDKELGPR